MRDEFLEGKLPEECQRCALEEAAGFRSHRIFENENARYSAEQIQQKEYLKGPKILVMRMSNLCNLACRTCHSLDSNQFKREGVFYSKNYGDTTSRYLESEPPREVNDTEIEEVMRLTDNLEEVHFYGGEPMLNRTHHRLLEHLVQKRDSSKIKLFYCTNGTKLPTAKLFSMWKQFKNVHLSYSIDGIEEGYEYLRWPAKWEIVRDNIYHARDVLRKDAQMSLSFNLTVSSMNIFYLPEIYAHLDNIVPFSVTLTTVHDPVYFSIRHLPRSIKLEIVKSLNASAVAPKFQGLCEYMMSKPADPTVWRQFVQWTEKMDAYRNQKFRTTFPGYYHVMREEYLEVAREFSTVPRFSDRKPLLQDTQS